MDLPLAGALLEESLGLVTELGDEWLQVLALLWLSNVAALRGEAARQEMLFGRCLALAEHQGDPWRLVAPLADVAQDAFMKGDLRKAQETLLRMESILRIVGDHWTLSWVLSELGRLALTRGEFELARGYSLEGLGLARESGNMIVMVSSLAQTAVLVTEHFQAAEGGQREAGFRRAARLCGGVKPFFDHPLLLGGPGFKEVCKELIDQAHARVDESVWEPAFAEGTATSLDQAVSMAEKELRDDLF
jgi:hypothetical protein